jgi:hypothetical protein
MKRCSSDNNWYFILFALLYVVYLAENWFCVVWEHILMISIRNQLRMLYVWIRLVPQVCRLCIMVLHMRYFTRTRLVYLISSAINIVGITGLLWNRHFGHSTQITINDNSSEAIECIQQNSDLNGIAWRKGASNNDSSDLNGTSSEGVEITHSDANVLMHQRQFHFM